MEINYSIERGGARISTGVNPATGLREIRVERVNTEGMTRGVWIPLEDFVAAASTYIGLHVNGKADDPRA